MQAHSYRSREYPGYLGSFRDVSSQMLYSRMGLSESADGVMEERQKRFSRYQKVL